MNDPTAASPETSTQELRDFTQMDLETVLESDVVSQFGKFAGLVSSAAKHDQDIGESPSAISVITRQQIENTACLDLVCLLRQVPEAMVLRISPMFAAVGARALVDENGDKVLVLLDGQEVNNEIFGTVFWDILPIHLEDIDRIEVIRGPGSALYGANAHSMVVSIFTRKSSSQVARAFVGAGELGTSSLHLRFGQKLGNWNLQASGGMERTGPWRAIDPRKAAVERARLAIDREGETSASSIRLGLVQAEGSIFTVLGPLQMSDTTLLYAMGSHATDLFQGKIAFNLIDSKFILSSSEIFYQGIRLGHMEPVVPFTSVDVDGEMQLSFSPFYGNQLITGASYRFVYATSQGTQPSDIFQHGVGWFIHDEQRLFDRLFLTGSIRLDYHNLTPFTASPRLAVVWKFLQGQFARISFSQAFRKPSLLNSSVHFSQVTPEPSFPEFKDLLLKGSGNADIENEQITSTEVGYYGRFLDEKLVVETDAFYNRYRNAITLHVDIVTGSLGLPDLKNSSLQFRNNGRDVDSLGGSLALTLRLHEELRLSAHYSFRYSTYASKPTGINVAGGKARGDRLSWEPSHVVHLSVQVLPANGLRWGLSFFLCSSREGYLPANSALDARVVVPIPTQGMLDGFLAWRLAEDPGWIEFGVRGSNLLKTSFWDFPGRYNSWEDSVAGGEPIVRRLLLFVRGAI